MKKTKICFVTREYAHPNMGKTGGIGVFIKQFTQALASKGCSITVFTFGRGPATDFMDEDVHVHNVKDLTPFNAWIKTPFQKYNLPGYITLKNLLEYGNRRYVSYKLTRYLKKNVFDLVEFHDYGGDTPFVKTTIPKVVRCHGTAVTLHEFMGYPLRLQDAKYERLFFKRVHAQVVAVSQYSADTTQRAFGLKTKPKVIYNGVRIPDHEKKSSYLDAPTIPFSIWYFGSIRERKGIDIACMVFNQVLELFPTASFHVMGNNNNKHWDKVAVGILSKKALKNTTYYGTVPNAQIYEHLKKAHVVIFPSFGENFSIALLEVMALGKLAITSNIPSFLEIVKNNQNGITVFNASDYAPTISDIFNAKVDIDLISKNAIETIRVKFSMDRIIKENIQYYNSVLESNY